jgi:hypothetical protein
MAVDPRPEAVEAADPADPRAQIPVSRPTPPIAAPAAVSSTSPAATITAPLVAPPVTPIVAPRTLPDPPQAVPVDAEPERRPPMEPRDGRVRYEARQVQRLVTRVDPWSVLKLSIFLALSAWVILVVAGVVLWRVAITTGTIGKFENFTAQLLAEESFIIDGAQVLRASLIAGLVLVLTGVVFAVVFSVLFNLIAGLTGGLRLTVIELETTRRRRANRSGGPGS